MAELQVETLSNGSGDRVTKVGDEISMHYEGTLENGNVFDSSYRRGEPFQFTLGAGMVIKGWDQGLQNMAKGEVRRLVIPPHMAYGEGGYPPVIPPRSTLIFKVELLDWA